MDFNTDQISIDENPTKLHQLQASSTTASQYTFVDIMPERLAISNSYASHEQAVSASSPGKPTTSDDIEIFRQTLAGNWSAMQTSNTISGQPDSMIYWSYLYNRRMIIRDIIQNSQALNSSTDNQNLIKSSKIHQVRCCHCSRKWGPYSPNYTTTSCFIRHFQKHHSTLPSTEEKEKHYLGAMGVMKRKRKGEATDVTPWILSGGARAPGQSFDYHVFRKLLVCFIVNTNSSFNITMSQSFRDLLEYCHPNVKAVSGQTLARDLHQMYREMLPAVKIRLFNHTNKGGPINLTLDAWTSSNRIAYLGITGHWMDSDYVLQNIVLVFSRLHGSHTGENLANTVYDTLLLYGIEQSLGCITMDNASVNDKLCKQLEQKLCSNRQGWKRKDGQVRCMPHVLNLAAQKILAVLKAEATIPEEVLAEAEGPGIPRTEDLGGLESANGIAVSPALRKARQILSKIRASNILGEALERECQAICLIPLRPLLDMRVRWNSTYMMLERLLYLRPAIERLTLFEEKLSKFTLTEGDWNMLSSVKDILHSFHNSTTHLSAVQYPTLLLQLPYYELLLRHFRYLRFDQKDKSGSTSMLFKACDAAFTVLNSYWNKSDEQSALSIALLLDPQCKLITLKRLGWTERYINQSVRNFYRIYDEKYAPQAPSRPMTPEHTPVSENDDLLTELLKMTEVTPTPSEADASSLASSLTADSEAIVYLSQSCENHKVSVILWWKVNSHRFPHLSGMASDYLAIPASSVPSEQLFSWAGDIITKKRNRMGPAAGPTLVLKSWLGLREVEDWELKLDAEEESQVEEVDRLFREHAPHT